MLPCDPENHRGRSDTAACLKRYPEQKPPLIGFCRVAIAGLLLVAGRLVLASPLFDSDDVLAMTINGPFSDLMESDERIEPVFLLALDGEELPVRIRTRGKSRLRVCKFPPLRIEFAERPDEGAFSGQDRLKLVTHCKDTDASEQDLLEEYAAYRLLNLISEFSYRVRLARIAYTDATGEVFARRAAFFIESGNEFERRLGLARATLPAVTLSDLDQRQAALVFVFQYLIGNTDWSLVRADSDTECCHNIDLFQLDGKLVAVAYDFDLAGLVNAAYARPDPSLDIPRVTTRLYRGYCLSPDVLRAALNTVVTQRPELLEVIDRVPGLDRDAAGALRAYLDRFFEQGRKQKKLLAKFERACL